MNTGGASCQSCYTIYTGSSSFFERRRPAVLYIKAVCLDTTFAITIPDVHRIQAVCQLIFISSNENLKVSV